MRKIIAVLASVLMIVTLAACGKKGRKTILAGRKYCIRQYGSTCKGGAGEK